MLRTFSGQEITTHRDLSFRSCLPHVWTPACFDNSANNNMLWTIFVILLVLWLLGLVTSYTFGGFVHILLVVALVVLVIRVLQGRRVG